MCLDLERDKKNDDCRVLEEAGGLVKFYINKVKRIIY